MNRITAWYHGLSNQWKATLRTMLQNAVASALVFALGLVAVLSDVVNGGTIEDAITDTANLAKLLLLALLSLVSGLITYLMNASGEKAIYPNDPRN